VLDENAISTAWAEVEARWDDPEAHDAFRTLCARLDRLDAAGRRYRAVREAGGPRAEEAERQQQKLLATAMSRLEASRSIPPPAPRRRRPRGLLLLAVGIALALVAASLWSFLSRGW
jgi:ferric-dicitrate binding protein FerR (iron transport regulator)